MEAALARIEEFILGFSRRMIKAAQEEAEIFWFGDDFASQKGMLISPEAWRRFLKPVYGRIFALAKSGGMKVWFHSCGTLPARDGGPGRDRPRRLGNLPGSPGRQ